MKFYKLKLLDLERDLPILKTPSGIEIAGFNSVGDMELLTKSGKYLADIIIENNIKYDAVLTTELKGLPIAQEVAKNLKCDYVCLRKEDKCYMLNPTSTEGESITSGKTNYYISQPDLLKLKNKKIIFVDDVFSTGSTFNRMIEFAKKENIELVAGLCILKEEKENTGLNFTFNNMPVYCVEFLPLP